MPGGAGPGPLTGHLGVNPQNVAPNSAHASLGLAGNEVSDRSGEKEETEETEETEEAEGTEEAESAQEAST